MEPGGGHLDQLERTRLLIGADGIAKLNRSHVAVFGIGGVGGYVCEALVRSGVGEFDLIDNDTVAESNLNRQIIALHSTIGRHKVDVMYERMKDINPDVRVNVHKCFFLPENSSGFPFEEYDYVVDAVDTVTAKLELIMKARECNVPVISSMGAGNKLRADMFRVADIYDTRVCPLARVMRRELKKRGVESLKVVYSEEEPLTPAEDMRTERSSADRGSDLSGDDTIMTGSRRSIPGSTAFAPAAAGLIIAGEVVKDLIFLDK